MSKRTFREDQPGLLQHIADAHCFDTTAVCPLVEQLMKPREPEQGRAAFVEIKGKLIREMSLNQQMALASMAERTAFLPAPITWIEFEFPGMGRDGYLLVDDMYSEGEEKWITVFRSNETGSDFIFSFPTRSAAGSVVHAIDGQRKHNVKLTKEEQLCLGIFLPLILCKLAIINTPKIVFQRMHLPHAGLQRRLARAHNMPGKYPLQAWHEVLLRVSVPVEFADKSKDAYLTGTKALHFCRAFLRVRLGQLELVHAHWRGNPALGIKQTRYRVVP
jgi:hypothetical protein